MKKIMFFSLGLLVVTGPFNMIFGYQDQTAGSQLATGYGCDDLVVRIRARDFIQGEPTELTMSFRHTPSLLEALELGGYDVNQVDFKGIHRSLILEFRLRHRTEGGRTWPAYGEDSNISIVSTATSIDSSEIERPSVEVEEPEDYRAIALNLVRGAVSDGLIEIADLVSRFQICQPGDKGLSLKLESVARVHLPFVSLKTFEAIANQEDTNDTFHRVDITGFISEAFFDQLTPEYLSQLRNLMFRQ